MCGCRKSTPAVAAAQAVAQSAALMRSNVEPLRQSKSIQQLRYLGNNAKQDLANVPSGATYVLIRNIATVFAQDVPTLLARKNGAGQPVFSIGVQT